MCPYITPGISKKGPNHQGYHLTKGSKVKSPQNLKTLNPNLPPKYLGGPVWALNLDPLYNPCLHYRS